MARVRVKRTLERFVIWVAALGLVPYAVFLALNGLHVRPAAAGWVAGLVQGLIVIPAVFEVRRRILARLAAAAKTAAAEQRRARAAAAKGARP